jgi:hypothetical protein
MSSTSIEKLNNTTRRNIEINEDENLTFESLLIEVETKK